MNNLKKILVAIDLDASADKVLEQVASLIAESDIQVTLLHVGHSTIPMYGGFMGEGAYIPNAMTDETEVRKDIQQKLSSRVQEVGLSSAKIMVEFGRTVDVILDVAKKDKVDLIVLGSHGRHGVGLLLGSTANGVLHRAECDVLAVRIKE